jgi:hypothetical protein
MSKTPEPEISREDLARARDAVRLQIAIFGGGSGGAAMAKLREVLAGLKEELAETEGGISGDPLINTASESRRSGPRRHLQQDDLKAILLLTALLVPLLLCTVFSPLVAPLLAPLLPASITQPQYSHFNWALDQKWTCNAQSIDVTCPRKP